MQKTDQLLHLKILKQFQGLSQLQNFFIMLINDIISGNSNRYEKILLIKRIIVHKQIISICITRITKNSKEIRKRNNTRFNNSINELKGLITYFKGEKPKSKSVKTKKVSTCYFRNNWYFCFYCYNLKFCNIIYNWLGTDCYTNLKSNCP